MEAPVAAPVKKLVDLHPKWINASGRHGVGVSFDHPRPSPGGAGGVRVLFANPLDGGDPLPNAASTPSNNDGVRWLRTGETFETLSLHPSIDEGKPGWHGWVRNGVVT